MKIKTIILGTLVGLLISSHAAFCAGIVLDESNATLAGDAGLGYTSLASPDIDPNFIGFKAGSASWNVSLNPAQKYKLTTRRTVTTTNNTQFSVSLDGKYYITDPAYTSDVSQNDQMLERGFFGYYQPLGATSSVVADSGGQWFARVDYLRLDPTYDSYFDENSSLTLGGGAARHTFDTSGWQPANAGTMPVSGPNGFAFAGSDYVSGNVTLVSGASYKVYASRQVVSYGNLSYDLAINGQLFAHDSAVTVNPVHENFLEEAYLGTFIAVNASNLVKCYNGGIWAARIDYIRFEQASISTIADAKLSGDGAGLLVGPAVITAAYPNFFYIESESCECGIRVEKAAHGLSVGARVSVNGVLQTNSDGERYIQASSVVSNGTGEVRPLGTSCRALGGGDFNYSQTTGAGQIGINGANGLNNIGMLVRTWGRVSSLGSNRYALTDGSGDDVTVVTPAGVGITSGAFTTLAGISSCENDNGVIKRVLLVSSASDIREYLGTNGDFSIGLNKNKNYALSTITVDGVVFDSSEKFPTFQMYDSSGVVSTFSADDSGWSTSASVSGDTVTVIYSRTGFSAKVEYKQTADTITVTVTPLTETGYKALGLSDGNSLVYVPKTKVEAANTAFLLVPYGCGELVKYPASGASATVSPVQSWDYQAQFFGVGYKNCGLLFRCPQYGATFTYGTGLIGSNYSLVGGMSSWFRPSAIRSFSTPITDPYLQVQITAVRDCNGDGSFDWVDMGSVYRDKYIEPNTSIDPNVIRAFTGKIDVSYPADSGQIQNYDQILAQMRQMETVPQVWWLVGAHVPTTRAYVDPCYSAAPDPSHNGPSGMDYFAFKQKALAEMGARIGIHESPQDMTDESPEWGSVPLRLRSDGYGVPRWGGTYNGRTWVNYSRSLNYQGLLDTIDYHFNDWQVNAGDTWHWDVFTAEQSQEDYNPQYLATAGTDMRTRIDILRYIKNKGVHITSEGLQEGLSTYCDLAWQARPAEMPDLDGAELVPLTPVLFLGRTVYCSGLSVSNSLLLGAKHGDEKALLDVDAIKSGYDNQNRAWRCIAGRTVRDVNKTTSGWQVFYKCETGGEKQSESVLDSDAVLGINAEARIVHGADGKIRRYNLTTDGDVDAVSTPVAAIDRVAYAGYGGVVTLESDGKVRRYNFYTGGVKDIDFLPAYPIVDVLYAGFGGILVKDTQDRIRRYNFTADPVCDAVRLSSYAVSEFLYSDFQWTVTRESDGKIRRYNIATGSVVTSTPTTGITSIVWASSSGVVIRHSDGKIRRYNFASGGGVDVVCTPASGITQISYGGFDGVVTNESDGKTRRYNFALPGGSKDAELVHAASVAESLYSGFAGVVARESDGKIRRYNLGSGGVVDAVCAPVSGVSHIAYSGYDGVVVHETDGKIRRYSFTASGSLDSVVSPVSAVQDIAFCSYDAIVTGESDSKLRCYTLNYVESLTVNLPTDIWSFDFRK
ncbi:MAG: WD40 repeat domain-containing protein [Armatimonadota bacterium]